jgi:hypothetical protein
MYLDNMSSTKTQGTSLPRAGNKLCLVGHHPIQSRAVIPTAGA